MNLKEIFDSKCCPNCNKEFSNAFSAYYPLRCKVCDISIECTNSGKQYKMIKHFDNYYAIWHSYLPDFDKVQCGIFKREQAFDINFELPIDLKESTIQTIITFE